MCTWNASINGNDLRNLPDGYNDVHIFLGFDCPRGNADSKPLESIIAT